MENFRVVLIGATVAIALTILSAVAISVLVIAGRMQEISVQRAIIVTQIISCAVGFMVTGKQTSEKIAAYMVFSGALYLAVNALIGVILAGDDFRPALSGVIVAGVSYMLGCAVCIRKNNRPKSRKYKIR